MAGIIYQTNWQLPISKSSFVIFTLPSWKKCNFKSVFGTQVVDYWTIASNEKNQYHLNFFHHFVANFFLKNQLFLAFEINSALYRQIASFCNYFFLRNMISRFFAHFLWFLECYALAWLQQIHRIIILYYRTYWIHATL